MDQNHMPGMEGMASPPMQMNNTSSDNHMSTMVMAHMTFFWSKNAEILFSGWPGTRTGMYVLALVFVFILSVLVEWLSYCKWINKDSNLEKSSAAVIENTIKHGVKMAISYLVMLAVMSFNVGVLIVAVAGHTFGFLVFGCKKRLPSSSRNLTPAGSC